MIKDFEEFCKRYETYKKEDVLYVYFDIVNLFCKFEDFMKLKYGDDYNDGWLYYLRTGKLKDEEVC